MSEDQIVNKSVETATTDSSVPSVRTKRGALKQSAKWLMQSVNSVPARLDSGSRFLVRAWCDPDNRLPSLVVNKRSWVLGAKLALVGILAYGFIDCIYIVDVGQEGVHLRLGRFSHVTQPGLNFQIPYGIDEVVIVNTQFILQDEFGFRTRIEQGPIELVSAAPVPPPDQGDQEVVDAEIERTELMAEAPATQLIGHPDFLKAESHMITGNLNIVDVSWAMQYEIVDSYKYLYRSADVSKNVRDIGAIAMSRAVGNRLDMEILTHSRGALEKDAKRYAQELLDKFDIGLQVRDVLVQDVSPPPGTQASYHAVTSASQEVDNLINQAEREYNAATVKAYGEADEIISQAEAYKLLTVNRAQGEAKRFEQIVTAYKTAPEVTRTRIFLETMEDVVSKVPYTVVDSDIQGIMPLLTGRHSTENRLPSLMEVSHGSHQPSLGGRHHVTNSLEPLALDPATRAQGPTGAPANIPAAVQPAVSGAPAASAGQTSHAPSAAAPMTSAQPVAAANVQPQTPAQAQQQATKTGWSFFGWW